MPAAALLVAALLAAPARPAPASPPPPLAAPAPPTASRPSPPAPAAPTTPAASGAPDGAVAGGAYRLQELVVTGSRTEEKRRDATSSVEVIDREAIESAGAENVAEILETHPGVDLERGMRGFGVRLQGLDPEYVLVLVDGERALGRLGGVLDLTRFPTENVERVEIVKGAGSALYGSDAVGGVINIITRRARARLEAGGHLSGGSLGTTDLSTRVGGRLGSVDGLVTVGHHRASSWDLSPDTPGDTANGAKTSDVALSAGWRPADRFNLRARGQYLRRDQTGVGANETGALFDRRTLSEDTSASLEPSWRFAGGSRLTLTGHYGLLVDQFLSDQRGSSLLDQVQKTQEHLARGSAQLDLVLGARHLLVSGAEVLYERMRSPRMTESSTDRTRASLFLQHEWRWLDRPRLTFQPGLRFDADTQFGGHVSPKLAVRYDPHPSWVLRASVGFAYRAPSFQELYLAFDNPAAGYMVAGNPDLQPETSRGVNAGFEWRPAPPPGLERFRDRFWLTGSLFRTDLENLIQVGVTEMVDALSRFSYENVARAHTQGLETGLGIEPLTGLRADLGYALTLAHDEENDRPLEGRARHRGTFRLSYRHDGAGFTATGRGSLVGARPFYEDRNGDGMIERVDAGAYAALGVRLSQRVWRRIELFVGGDNLLDNGDELHLPIPPRTFYGGLDFDF